MTKATGGSGCCRRYRSRKNGSTGSISFRAVVLTVPCMGLGGPEFKSDSVGVSASAS
ncbi:MAG: hypothetical protein CM1200mP20_08150 [Pseudomonadota bacterium]|nr:MAG: hypothetical protein CM1200mP20_08150 [Pseudomonadota bacterium]